MLLKDMVFDGRYPNLRVDPAYFESKHPQEALPKVDDAIGLYRPSPQNLKPPTTPALSGNLIAGPAVSLMWSESTSQAALVIEYLLYRALGDGEFELLATIDVERDEFAAITSARAYTDETVESAQTYRYQLVARAVKGGDSTPSNVVEITVG